MVRTWVSHLPFLLGVPGYSRFVLQEELDRRRGMDHGQMLCGAGGGEGVERRIYVGWTVEDVDIADNLGPLVRE